MRKKKIAIIGRGTAGSLASSHISTYSSDEIIWYHDSNVSRQSVGEGSTVPLPVLLYDSYGFNFQDIKKIDGTFKRGIKKENWGGSGDFMHPFPLAASGIHFNATKLQDYIHQKLEKKIQIIDKNIIDPQDLDVDYVLDCSGKLPPFNEAIKASSIPLNAAHIVQCYWDKPQFDYTLTIARPYGWVFGIPLQNRCSIGYLYDKNINTLEEVKEDIKNIFKKYNLTPSDKVNNLNFNNYYRKQNYTNKVSYNGNSSFFLEPLEATSTGMMDTINRNFCNIVYNNKSIESANFTYHKNMVDTQRMIMLHYLAGSKFSTPFWEEAYKKSLTFLNNNLHQPDFLEIYNRSKEYSKRGFKSYIEPFNEIGQWAFASYNMHFEELDLYNKIDNILN